MSVFVDVTTNIFGQVKYKDNQDGENCIDKIENIEIKFTLQEVKELFEKISGGIKSNGYICYETKTIDLTAKGLCYPVAENGKFILGCKNFKELCELNSMDEFDAFITNINNVYQQNEENFDKEEFINSFINLRQRALMTEEEGFEFIRKIPDLNTDEWILELPNSLNISNYNLGRPLPPIEVQTNIFNELLSHFFTAELVYSIETEINNTELSTEELNEVLSKNQNNYNIQEFKDIKQKIQEKNSPEIKQIYDVYYILKCFCFILHDKPVNELAPFLIKQFDGMIKTRTVNENTRAIINELIKKYKEGFNINDLKSSATQTRCHKTIDELTKYFNNIMRQYGINVPKNIKVRSFPQSAFKLEKEIIKNGKEEVEKTITKELEKILNIYNFGLADAVGNDTFIKNFGKMSIYPDTLSLQDAAGSTHSKEEILVKETGVFLENGKTKIKYDIYEIKNQNTKKIEEFDIEPLSFLDVSIFCQKIEVNNIVKNVFLYYAHINPNIDVNTLVFPDQYKKYKEITIGSDKKTLIGIATGKVSQNDTISLLKGIIDISSSARGTGKFYINPNIWVLETGDKYTNELIKTYLAVLMKEAGDQSKIQVVENLSRNGYKSYIATVDSFLSESFINGGVLFKGGNIEVFIPEGFEVVNANEIEPIIKNLGKINKYGFKKIKDNIKQFCDKVYKIIIEILNDKTLYLPHTTEFALFAMCKVFKDSGYFLEQQTFNTVYNNGIFDNNIHSGVKDIVSFLRRITNFDKINKLFTMLDDEVNENFCMNIDKGKFKQIDELINRFLTRKIEENLNEENILKGITSLVQEMPLFFLMRNIEKIKNTTFKQIGSKRQTGKRSYDGVLIESDTIAKLIIDVLILKFKSFCEEYFISIVSCNKYIDYIIKGIAFKLEPADLINKEYKNYEDKFDETDLQDEEENGENIEFIGYRKDENIENNENNETAMDIVEEQESIFKEQEPSSKRAKYGGTIKKGADKKKRNKVTIRRRAI